MTSVYVAVMIWQAVDSVKKVDRKKYLIYLSIQIQEPARHKVNVQLLVMSLTSFPIFHAEDV